jgi:hypothetical protein
MMIPLYCPECGKELCVRHEILGNLVRCPLCEAVFKAVIGMEPPPTPYALAPAPPVRMGPEPQLYMPGEGLDSYVPLEADRGGLILALGLAGLVMSGCPLAGWILGGLGMRLGGIDIDRMDAGRMDPAGRSLTVAGRICGIIAVILSTLSSLAGILVLVMYLLR